MKFVFFAGKNMRVAHLFFFPLLGRDHGFWVVKASAVRSRHKGKSFGSKVSDNLKLSCMSVIIRQVILVLTQILSLKHLATFNSFLLCGNYQNEWRQLSVYTRVSFMCRILTNHVSCLLTHCSRVRNFLLCDRVFLCSRYHLSRSLMLVFTDTSEDQTMVSNFHSL